MCGAIGHQKCKDFLWGLDEKLTFLVLRRLEERNRQSLCLGAAAQLFGRTPIRTPRVERIQDHVSVFRVVKALDELSCGVINDGGIATSFYLSKDLQHDGCLAFVRIAVVAAVARPWRGKMGAG